MTKLLLNLLLVTMVIFIGSMVFAEDLQCAQCVSGHFLKRQWMMQHAPAGQSMGWVHEWKGTDCEKGKLHIIVCFTSCIRIDMEKNSTTGWAEDGYMRDCADDLIHMSPDLPKGNDYLNFKRNATFSNIRWGYRITYEFSMVRFPGNLTIRAARHATYPIDSSPKKQMIGSELVDKTMSSSQQLLEESEINN